MLYLIVEGTEVKGLTTNSEISNIESPITEEQYTELNTFLTYESEELQLNLSSFIGNIDIVFEHNIEDTNPENGIPEIPGDGISTASITIKLRAGNIYSLTSTGQGDWDYERVKVSDGSIISDDTYEGNKLGLTVTKGMLNKTEVTLDVESKGSFKIKSEAKTCVGEDASVITSCSKDINNCNSNNLSIEFAPVEF